MGPVKASCFTDSTPFIQKQCKPFIGAHSKTTYAIDVMYISIMIFVPFSSPCNMQKVIHLVLYLIFFSSFMYFLSLIFIDVVYCDLCMIITLFGRCVKILCCCVLMQLLYLLKSLYHAALLSGIYVSNNLTVCSICLSNFCAA